MNDTTNINETALYALLERNGLIHEWMSPGEKHDVYVKCKKITEVILHECFTINREELSFAAFERLFDRYQSHFGIVDDYTREL